MFPRKLLTRKFTAALVGTVKVTPLKLTVLLDCSRPGTAAGTGPDPLSTVSETSVALVAEMRFVTPTFKETMKFRVIVEPGLPPEQLRRISPRVSAMPSACTVGLTALVAQIKAVDWGVAMLAKRINSAGKNEARIDIRLRGELLFEGAGYSYDTNKWGRLIACPIGWQAISLPHKRLHT